VIEPLRYGLIGAGMMGLEHQRNLHAVADVVVVAAADPEPSSLEWATIGADGRELATYEDYRDLLAADLCDVYVISSPNMTHRVVLEDVMRTGRHVLVEKPLCTTVDDARFIRDRAATYPAVFWVGLEYRYMPPVAEAIAIADRGELGDIHMIALREHRHPFLRKVGDWNRFNENTGGTLVEKCCHFFDLMRRIAHADPVRVMASGSQAVNHRDEQYSGRTPDILDNAFVIVDFDNGVRASLDLCMFAEGSRNNEELSVVGSTGKVESFLPSGLVRVGRRATWGAVAERDVSDDRVLVEGFHHGASYLEHLDMVHAIRAGTPALVTAEDGYWSVVMGVAAQQSLSEHRVVDVSEIL
jgi:myo-inositol 2-dehydrogenase / D-chiro-inositol 1-dehydrogenase